MPNGLQTDLYELAMAAGYWRAGFTHPATFELFVRRLPPSRGYLIAAGLDDAIAFLERVRFSDEDRQWLRRLPQFADVPASFFDDYLSGFRFTGDVWAMPEGTPVFEHEPLLRVTAPLPDAQLVETALLAIVGFQTAVATKAARLVDAAAGRAIVEFGARRAHGLGSALDAARAAFVGGCEATSYVEAARRFGIPVSGTMAHSWVQTFPTELAAFHEFSRTFESSAVYLLDTYDTLHAARALATSGLQPAAVRIDSGDLAALSREVRRILDDSGHRRTKIFATGDLDEHAIARLVGDGAAIDAFGVGTALSTVSDAPALSAVYKLVAIERDGRRVDVIKSSPGKHTWPGAKQVWRTLEGAPSHHDIVAGDEEPPAANARPLLAHVFGTGGRTAPREALAVIRDRCRTERARLPSDVRALDAPRTYDVRISDALEARRRAAQPQTA